MTETLRQLKWAALQPLTGGMYLGAEEAIGHPAEFIISYPGFDAPKYNKQGELVDAGNEYHLKTYLEKHNRMPAYYQFDREPFQNDNDMNPQILKDGQPVETPNYEDIDLVVAVPVCAGLSGATSNATAEVKASRNCNMVWLAKYAINVIRPKVYIFENAPRFMSNAGDYVRREIEKIAHDAGYSLGYYKTDTKWHDNCQIRPRTFIYFFRIDEENRKGTPALGWERKNVSIEEFLSRIPENATQKETVPMGKLQTAILRFVEHMYGENWREQMHCGSLIEEIIKTKHLDEFNTWVQTSEDFDETTKKQVAKHVTHIKDKFAQGLGFYAVTPVIAQREGMPSAMFKTIPNVIHYKENRLYNIREWLSAMGMPYDFEMQGNYLKNFPKIGQNVPAHTAEFIVKEAVKVIENWNTVERSPEANVVFFDNNKQQAEVIMDLGI